ncbi:TVP38/TMEM64 family protein [Romboutsia hominis]|nr:TVP38/TMEM64 family protein [Romboutsia sp. 1001216sp1]MCH1960470.1 TVP38/TMEM64 family protein [Romboutsia hominis]MCH1969097.1 TVP38/TMEM64 family protein [Romboutsia hominis]MDB8805989.1 TVP38/TMEM64 family protein [Romboutsia sp. 1001216sp1]MDB8807567.1 TVP38/TMEM64 family protein [Romboutsia sp. 1001216sp1]MDB8811190.1 TVP38/TMEM64 family protein [Romboutsia sp. 1001216sp1]
MDNKLKNISVKIGVSLLVIGIYLFIPQINKGINQMIFYLSMLNIDAIKEYILSFGILAPIISFLLMILQSVAAPLPAFLITFANAALFGWVKGAMLSWTSSMVGAALCFYIARFLGRDVVIKLTSKYALDNIDNFFDKYGKHTILIARLLPFISFDLVSYAAGLTSMKFSSFFIATGIGQLPATIIYSYVGDMLTGSLKFVVTGLMILFALSILGYMLKKIYNEKNSNLNKSLKEK